MNLILTGYRGSGKTTIGQMLAQKLGWRFVDLDEVIVQRTGRTISELFAAEGEAGFRRHEKEACDFLRKGKNQVIALGGGTLNDPETRAAVKRLGKTIWLSAPPAVLWARISRDPKSARNRPDLTPEGGLKEVETVLQEREPIYRSAAAHIVDTVNDSPEQIADSIEMWFRANDTEAG